MAALNYLTVQDVLWIHEGLTKKTVAFDFAKLEEATFYQYGYGPSADLVKQAAKFLKGFTKQAPFEEANEQTALVATAAFLAMNGRHLNLPGAEAKTWLARVKSGETNAEEALAKLALESDDHHYPAAPEALDAALAEYGS